MLQNTVFPSLWRPERCRYRDSSRIPFSSNMNTFRSLILSSSGSEVLVCRIPGVNAMEIMPYSGVVAVLLHAADSIHRIMYVICFFIVSRLSESYCPSFLVLPRLDLEVALDLLHFYCVVRVIDTAPCQSYVVGV